MALMIPRAGALEQEGLQPPAMSHLVSARGPAHMVLDAGARAYQPVGVQGGLLGEAVPPQPPDIKRRDELDPDWDNHVHAFKRQYLYIAIAYATPCFCIFMYSVFKSILYRGWWNTSAGEPYMPHSMNEQNPYRAYIGIPSVLEMHMWFACMMLAAICVQLGSMWMAVHTGIDAYGKFHAMFGKVTMFVIILAAGLGTIGLGVCDVQPKRGAENLFFRGIRCRYPRLPLPWGVRRKPWFLWAPLPVHGGRRGVDIFAWMEPNHRRDSPQLRMAVEAYRPGMFHHQLLGPTWLSVFLVISGWDELRVLLVARRFQGPVLQGELHRLRSSRRPGGHTLRVRLADVLRLRRSRGTAYDPAVHGRGLPGLEEFHQRRPHTGLVLAIQGLWRLLGKPEAVSPRNICPLWWRRIFRVSPHESPTRPCGRCWVQLNVYT